MSERILTTKDIAAMFGVDPKTVGRWVLEGRLKPSFRTLGGHARFRESEVRALLQGGEATSDA